MLLRLAVAFLVFLALDFTFWFTADFQTFFPPSDGPFRERLHFALLTATGPFAILYGGSLSNSWEFWAVEGPVLGVLFATGIFGRPLLVGRVFGYVGVAAWFFFGFMMTHFRIT